MGERKSHSGQRARCAGYFRLDGALVCGGRFQMAVLQACCANAGRCSTAATDPPGAAGVMTLTLEEYEALKQRRGEEITARLVGASEEDRARLASEKSELASRLADIETSYAKAQETITGLREAAERYGNALGAEKLEEARRVFEEGDFDTADSLFARVEDEGDLEVERTSAAAFQRGKIAEEQVRWADAADHYLRASLLSPKNFEAHRLAGEFLVKSGRLEEGEQIIRKLHHLTVKYFPKKSKERAISENDLGAILRARSHYRESEVHLLDAINLRNEILGAHHLTGESLNELAGLLEDMGRYREAEPLYRQALETTKTTLGEEHPDYAAGLSNLANLLNRSGRYDEAEPLYRQALGISEAMLGAGHPNHATHLNNLAELLRATGRYDEAEPLYRQALETTKTTLGEEHPDYSIRLNNLGLLLTATGRYAESERLFRQALEIDAKTIGTEHPSYATRLNNLAGLLEDMGRYDEAGPLYAQMMPIVRGKLGDDHPNTRAGAANYARLLRAHFPDDPALAELEATFGPDIGR